MIRSENAEQKQTNSPTRTRRQQYERGQGEYNNGEEEKQQEESKYHQGGGENQQQTDVLCPKKTRLTGLVRGMALRSQQQALTSLDGAQQAPLGVSSLLHQRKTSLEELIYNFKSQFSEIVHPLRDVPPAQQLQAFNFESWQCRRSELWRQSPTQQLWNKKLEERQFNSRKIRVQIGKQIAEFFMCSPHDSSVLVGAMEVEEVLQADNGALRAQMQSKNDMRHTEKMQQWYSQNEMQDEGLPPRQSTNQKTNKQQERGEHVYEQLFAQYCDRLHVPLLSEISIQFLALHEQCLSNCSKKLQELSEYAERAKQKAWQLSSQSLRIFEKQMAQDLVAKIQLILNSEQLRKYYEEQMQTLRNQFNTLTTGQNQASCSYEQIQRIVCSDGTFSIHHRNSPDQLAVVQEHIVSSLAFLKQVCELYENVQHFSDVTFVQQINEQKNKIRELMISVCEFVKNFWQLSPINHYWHKLQSILDRQRLNIYEKMRSNAAPPETAICTVNDFLVTAGDLQRLAPGQWLNDVLINCYCQLLIERQRLSAAGNPGAEKIVILPSQFFGNFYNTEKSSFYKDAVNQFFRSLRQKNIFQEYDKVGFVVYIQQHWVFIGVENRHKYIAYFDSFLSGDDTKYKQHLDCIYKIMAEESTDYKQYKHFERVKCPQQSNGFDCGVYVCKNAQNFVFGDCLPQQDLTRAYTQEDITKFRQNLYYLYASLGCGGGSIRQYDLLTFLEGRSASSTLGFQKFLEETIKQLVW